MCRFLLGASQDDSCHMQFFLIRSPLRNRQAVQHWLRRIHHAEFIQDADVANRLRQTIGGHQALMTTLQRHLRVRWTRIPLVRGGLTLLQNTMSTLLVRRRL